jgi:hypothetical protein
MKKIYLILDSSLRSELQEKLDLVHTKLLSRNLNSYKPENTTEFGHIIDNSNSTLIAASFYIGNVIEWDSSILEVVKQEDLVDLPSDWDN